MMQALKKRKKLRQNENTTLFPPLLTTCGAPHQNLGSAWPHAGSAVRSQRTQSHSSWWQGDPPVPLWVALLLGAARTGRGTAPGLSGSSQLPPANSNCSSFHRNSAAIGFGLLAETGSGHLPDFCASFPV